MSKTLKGTYLWNEIVSPPTQEFNIVFTHGAKTNYGTTSISKFNVTPRIDSNETVCTIKYDENIIYQSPTSPDWGWEHGAYRNITFGNGDLEETVSEEFYTWFIVNAVSLNDTVEITGTWEWNNPLYGCADNENGISFHENVDAMITISGSPIQIIRTEEIRDESRLNIFYMGTDIGGTGVDSIQSYTGVNYDEYDYYSGRWLHKGCQTITFNPGTKVSSKFYCWFVVNARSIELCEINGRWKWNDIPTHHTRDFDKVKINFKSGFTNMKYMLVEPDYESYTSDLTYISSKFERKAYGVIKQTDDTPKIVGTWRWKEVVSPDNIKNITVEFTNVSWNDINNVWPLNELEVRLATSGDWGDYVDLYYGVEDGLRHIYEVDEGEPRWDNEENRVLTFGEEATIKIVDDKITYEEFYNWFTANAERIDEVEIERSWTELEYRIIDFGDNAQLVTKDFYDWFTANATKQTLVEISGIWRLNEALVHEGATGLDQSIFEPVPFNLHVVNKSYLGMRITVSFETGTVMELHYCTYSEPIEAIIYDQIYRDDPINTYWTNELTNRVIDFGDTPKLVSSEFYEWFITRAIKFTHEISGTWALKEKSLSKSIDTFEYSSDNALFTSNGNDYKRLYIADTSEGLIIEYDNTVVYSHGVWIDDYYRVISIHNSIPVNESVYIWFVNNIVTDDFLLIEKATLIEIAGSIRAKTGKTDKIIVSNLKNEIASIPTSMDAIVSVSIREIK